MQLVVEVHPKNHILLVTCRSHMLAVEVQLLIRPTPGRVVGDSLTHWRCAIPRESFTISGTKCSDVMGSEDLWSYSKLSRTATGGVHSAWHHSWCCRRYWMYWVFESNGIGQGG